MISSVFSVLALTAVVGLILAIFVGAGVYVARVRRNGIDSVLAGARRTRELR